MEALIEYLSELNLTKDLVAPKIETREVYSRKVFLGGLPPDVDEAEITSSFYSFGPLQVDWPNKSETNSSFPPKGFAFLLFQSEDSVHLLINSCFRDDKGRTYYTVSSSSIKNKFVQIRPWKLSDSFAALDPALKVDHRKTIFVGGVPRSLKASELARIMEKFYGPVSHAGIHTDSDYKYPKGVGWITFTRPISYILAISSKYVWIHSASFGKLVEIKPYVLDLQLCDICQGNRCGGKFLSLFCQNVNCLQYLCEQCWMIRHSMPGYEGHRPFVKEGSNGPYSNIIRHLTRESHKPLLENKSSHYQNISSTPWSPLF